MKIHADLSMIRVFCAVYETGSVTRASRLMSLSQPATSYVLAQLREKTGNPLFNRTRGGMLPTPFAVTFYEKLKPLLEEIERALASMSEFEPDVAERTFRIAMSDIGEMMFIPTLLQHTHRTAPNIIIETQSINIAELEWLLRIGQLDFAIGFLPDLNDVLENVALFDEKYVCLYGAGNRHLSKGMTLESFLACPYVDVVSPSSNHHLFKHILKPQVSVGKVGLRVSHYATVPAAVVNSDMVVAVPSRIARMFSSINDLRISDLPFELPRINVRLYWCAAFAHESGHAWMRNTIVSALQKI